MKTPNWSLIPYEDRFRSDWDRLALQGRNGHFMFCRGFMDYHADRFDDFSFLLRRGRKIVALLPAHRKTEELNSHSGLSFGGWVQASDCRFMDIEAGFNLLAEAMVQHGLKRLRYTPSPYPYHSMPCGEDLFTLGRLGARQEDVRLGAFFRPDSLRQRPHELRRRLQRGRENLPLDFFETDDIETFWRHLEIFLAERHKTRPVHSLAEIRLLKNRFPKNIRFLVGRAGTKWDVGNVVFLHPQVLKFQYGFRDETTSEQMTVYRLWDWICRQDEFLRPWVDLGTSMAPDSNNLQHELHFHKETFGARSVPLGTWIWDICHG